MSYINSNLVNVGGNVTGVLPVVNGGTGVTTSTGTGSTVLNSAPNLVSPVIEDSGDTTKHVIFASGAAATGTTTTLAFQQSTNRTLFFPDATAAILYSSGPLGTPASGTLSNCTSLGGITSGSAVGTGIVGQQISSTYTSTAVNPTNGQWGNATSISLLSGVWLLFGSLYNTRVSGQTVMMLALSAFSNNTTTDHVPGTNVSRFDVGTWNQTSLAVGPWLVNISAGATYFMKVQQDAGTFAVAAWPGIMQAYRIG